MIGPPVNFLVAASLLVAVQAQTPVSERPGLLVVAHGASTAWNASVRATVSQVEWTQGPVGVAFLMGAEADTAGWDSASARLIRQGATRLVVVPLMVSTFGAHYRQIEHYAGARAELPAELGAHAHHVAALAVPAVVTPAIDDAPEAGDAIAARWRSLGERDRARPVLLIGHGPTTDADADRWIQHLSVHGERLRQAGFRAEFRAALLRDDAPAPVKARAIGAMRDTLAALAARHADSVLVMPIMIADGSIPRTGIPGHLAGLPYTAAPAGLTPHPSIARWIERVAAERLRAVLAETPQPPQ